MLSNLRKVGVVINDIYDLVNTKESYPEAIPVLLDLIKQGVEDVRVKEGIIRALAVREAVGLASPILLDEYKKTPKEQISLRWAIGNTIYTTITKSDTNAVLQLVQNKENGISRQMFVAALGRFKSKEVEDTLIELLDDDEVAPHALEALGKLKSIRALDKVYSLTKHKKTLVKKEAEKTFKKLKKYSK